MLAIITLRSCADEPTLDFSEESIERSDKAEIAINIPLAEGDQERSDLINSTLNNYIVSQCNLSEDSAGQLSLEDALVQFENEFEAFKTKFPDSAQQWEFFVDGEITFSSEHLICIALNTYLDTGGAHGNTNITFFNFNPETGEQFSLSELIDDSNSFSSLVEQELMKHLSAKDKGNTAEDYFFGKDFQLPESIGFSDEGVIILYNPYEIASYSQGIIEFTIPYEMIDSNLNLY
ncbi:MAG: DUF3298 and DUF4163 domain-containing protein [Psychroserpens sp.]|nr:DUF3298 and DUF4163 domain-containing protein [Psychroserpens sp.]